MSEQQTAGLPKGVSEFSHGQRLENYLGQFGGTDPTRRSEVFDLANMAATAEMLDEMHIMLRAIWERLK